MKINKIKIYYLILTIVIGVQIVTTIFQGGLSVHHGTKIAQLKLQKNNLVQEQIKLQTQLTQKSSISQVLSDQDLTQYHGIGDTIIITANHEVASR